MADYTEEHPFTDDELFGLASLGIEVEQFFATRVGRFIIKEAEGQIEEAYKELALVDPEDPKAIRSIQFRIRVAQAAPQWLATVIQKGHQAEEVIKMQDYDEDY